MIRREKAAMRRKTIRILALVLTLVMLVCQTGLAVRGTAGTGRLMSEGEGMGPTVTESNDAENITPPPGVFRH